MKRVWNASMWANAAFQHAWWMVRCTIHQKKFWNGCTKQSPWKKTWGFLQVCASVFVQSSFWVASSSTTYQSKKREGLCFWTEYEMSKKNKSSKKNQTKLLYFDYKFIIIRWIKTTCLTFFFVQSTDFMINKMNGKQLTLNIFVFNVIHLYISNVCSKIYLHLIHLK